MPRAAALDRRTSTSSEGTSRTWMISALMSSGYQSFMKSA
jgi:hypothetical protein